MIFYSEELLLVWHHAKPPITKLLFWTDVILYLHLIVLKQLNQKLNLLCCLYENIHDSIAAA